MIKKITLLFIFISTFSFGQDFRFGKVSKEELMEKQHPKYPEADAAILYRETKTHFEYSQNTDFHTVTEVFERIKIYNKAGMDWAKKAIKLYQGNGLMNDKVSGLKGYTYYLDGNKVKDEKLRNDGIFEEEVSEFMEVVRFALPNVTEGSIIEFKYTLRSPFIGDIEPYRFQEEIPVNKIEMRFSAPEYFNYKLHQRGGLSYNINESGGERTINYTYESRPQNRNGTYGSNLQRETVNTKLTFTEKDYEVSLTDVPPIEKEAYAGNINNYTATLQFELSYISIPNRPLKMVSTNWDNVSESIYKSSGFGKQLAKSNYFDKDLNRILKDASNNTEKAIRIFEYVKAKMNWNGYLGIYSQEGVRDAYKKEVGNAADINLMLVAMLRNAGIDANPILVSTKSHGIPIFPTRNGFNFVIAGVEIQNSVVLMDATDKESIPNLLQEELLNWKGRLIREDGSSAWVSLTPKDIAMESCMMQYSIDPQDLIAIGSTRTQYSGHFAMSNRSNFRNVSNSDRIKLLEKSMTGVEIDSSSIAKMENSYEPLKLTFDFHAPEAVEKISDKLYLSPMLFQAIEENPFKLDERKYPIDFGYPHMKRYLITISIPEGYTVETIPESVNFVIPNGKGSFKYIVNSTNNMLQCSVEFSIENSFMASNAYPEIKKLFEIMVKKENEKIVLTKV